MINIRIGKLGISTSIKFGKVDMGFHINQFYFGVKPALGIRNCTYDGKRVVFLDYDNILYERLVSELRYIQSEFKLGDFFILKSSQKKANYHAVCFTKVDVATWMDILQESSCDEAYKRPWLKDFNTCVLRVSPKGSADKPKYVERLDGYSGLISKPHFDFFHFHFKIPRYNYSFDDGKDVMLVDYETMNYKKKKEK